MREVRIDSFCDWCVKDGNIRTPSELTFHVVINTVVLQRPQTHMLDVCAAHYKSRILEFADLLEQLPVSDLADEPTFSTPPRVKAKARGKAEEIERCPFCPEEMRHASLVTHLWNKHSGPGKRPDPPKKCPECGAVMVNPSHMGTHRAQSHGWSAMGAAIAAAYDYAARVPE
jgi:uncharacterized C2H2 Zn-finger protein